MTQFNYHFDLPVDGFVKEWFMTFWEEKYIATNDKMSGGSHQIGFNHRGGLSQGIFFRLESGKYSSSIKMILMK
ncbi:MAG: hypothetical protein IPG53_06240 [Ignavibacteriales bacterium]|nr:hypothetical protein [Ignavibacteriales bacterium]